MTPSPELETALRAALESWDDPFAHERLLALAGARGELAALGRFYRLRLVAAPFDPVAQRGRDEVLRRASVAPAMSLASERGEKLPRWQYVVLAFLLIGCVGMLTFLGFQLASKGG
jgi:hypothetical protein